jgi:hypothetical protein
MTKQPGRKPGLFVLRLGRGHRESEERVLHQPASACRHTHAGTLADALGRPPRIATDSVDRPQPCVGARPPSGAAPSDSATTVTLRASGQPLDFAR